MTSITFRVDGVPIPQGSKTIAKGGGKTWLRDANATKLGPWRKAIAAEAAKVADVHGMYDCPVVVVGVFYLPRPKRPRWDLPAVKPDADKLGRALLDGLTQGGLLKDDSRVTDPMFPKRYASDKNPPGVRVLVMKAGEET